MANEATCVFCGIVRGDVRCRLVFEDEQMLVFHDIKPVAEIHFLMVPKRHIPSMMEVTADDAALLGKMLVLAPRLAREQGATDGFRLIVNTGTIGGQEVHHLHMHVIASARVLPGMIARL